MKNIKKILSTMTMSLALTLCLSVGAHATDGGIQVQLNGDLLSFTDATPISQDGRTVIPFRAIFNALGVTDEHIQYMPATNAVKITTDESVIELTIDSKDIKVTTDGTTETIQSDMAPFTMDGTTYVPVRFVAETMGLSVGWDIREKTVIIIDYDALFADTGAEFTIMNKYMEYNKKMMEGQYKFDGTFDFGVDVYADGETLGFSGEGTVDGIANAKKADLDLAMSIDLESFIEMAPEEEKAGLEFAALLLEDIEISYIMDLENMKMHLSSDLIAASLGMEGDVWILYDIQAMMRELGVDIGDLMEMVTELSFEEYLTATLKLFPVDNVMLYDMLEEQVTLTAKMYGDAAFVKTGNKYVSNFEETIPPEGGVYSTTTKSSLTLMTNSAGEVTAYDMVMTMSMGEDEIMSIIASMDEKNTTKMSMKMGVPEFLSMDMNMEINQTETTKEPTKVVPEGSVIIDIMELLMG